MPTRPEPKGARKCCCCIPIRGGIIILTWLYFFAGAAAAGLAFTVLAKASDLFEITLATKAFLLALAVLSILLAIVSAIGIFATIRLHPQAARLYYVLFYIWFLLQLALDIAVVVMFFTKTLDSLIPECKNVSSRRRPSANCENARNKMSWWYTVSMIVRSGITYYFVRRIASFSRHCAERTVAQLNLPSTPMAPASTFTSGVKSLHPSSIAPLRRDGPLTPETGTMFASNLPTRPTHMAHTQTFNSLDYNHGAAPETPNALRASPRSYQASAESTDDLVKEAPGYYDRNAA